MSRTVMVCESTLDAMTSPSNSTALSAESASSADVIVVGAGLTGLTAAIELARGGRSVIVCERDDAVGGRVRTDIVDGYLIDRGFQLLNPIYPTLREYVDLPALDLRKFGSGVEVLTDSGIETLANPVRHPLHVAPTLTSGLLSGGDIKAITGMVASGPGSIAAGEVPLGETTFGAELDARGAVGELRTKVLEPFLTGVVADDPNEIDVEVGRFLLTTFAFGRPSVPARGAQALPNQLAATARRAGAQIRLNTEVTRVDSTTVHTSSGEEFRAGAVVVATAAQDAGQPTRGLSTFWFRADEAPCDTPFVRVDGTRSGPVLNTAVMTNVAPTYSPDGSALIEASTLFDDSLDTAEVLAHLSRLWGVERPAWDLVARTDVEHALPSQRPGDRAAAKKAAAGASDAVIRAGDYVSGGSLQGAMAAGRDAANRILSRENG